MYNVSINYQNQIKKQIRNVSYLNVDLYVTDPNAKYNATVTGETSMILSDLNSIVYQHSSVYNTLEYNRIVLDNSAIIPNTSPYDKIGFLSTQLSDSSGEVTDETITIQFGNYYNFAGLTFIFDSKFGTKPQSMRIQCYNDTTLILDVTESPDNGLSYAFETVINSCNKIVLTIESLDTPNTRVRLETILFGLIEHFDSSVIVDSDWKRDVDVINAKIPSYGFNFTALDLEKKFNPENPDGIYKYLTEYQRVIFYYGYELDDGTIEWIKGGAYLTTGDMSVKSTSIISQITFNSMSALNLMTNIYKKGIFRTTPISLFDLATNLLETVQLAVNDDASNGWVLDDSLKNIYTVAALPKKPVNYLLQTIANAGMCILRVNRDGLITMLPEPSAMSNFAFPMSEMYSPPKMTKYPSLQGVDTSVNLITIDTATSKLLTSNLALSSNTTLEFEYDDATNISASVTGTLAIIGTPQYFTGYAIITLNGNGTLTLNGNKLVYANKSFSYEYDKTGERCPITNILNTSDDNIINYASWIANYAIRSNDYQVDDRGFPELDLDNIIFGTSISDNNYGTVHMLEIKYGGTISGTTKILTANRIFNKIYDAAGTFVAGQELRLPTLGNS